MKSFHLAISLSAFAIAHGGCSGGGEARLSVRERPSGLDALSSSERPAAAAKAAPGAAGEAVRVEMKSPGHVSRTPADIEYRIEASGPVERVEVWFSVDGGQTWSFSGEDPDRRSPARFTGLDGEYGIRLAAGVRGQEPLSAPRPGDAPQATIIIDTAPPEVELRDIRAHRPEAASRTVEIIAPFRVHDTHPEPSRIRLDWRGEDGRWNKVPLEKPRVEPEGEAVFRIPEPVREPLLLRLSAGDRAGNVSSRVEEVHVLDLLDPPHLELLTFDDGCLVRGGAAMEVRFRVDWPRLAEGGVALAFSPDGGKSWRPVDREVDPRAPFAWTVPSIDTSEAVLELSARGTCGFRAVRRTRPFRVDSTAPAARILGPRLSTRRDVKLSVWTRESGPAGLDRLVLWSGSERGAGWREVGTFPPGESIDFVSEQAGAVGLWLAAVDRAGNAGPAPKEGDPPAFVLEVDPRPATLALGSFSEGGVFRGGSRLYVFVRGDAALADRPMSIQLSDGPDRPFRPVAEGITFRDRWLWRLPEATGDGFRLRVEVEDRAGSPLRAVSARPFAIDSLPPRVEIESAEVIGGGRVRIRFAAEDAPAGLARLRLYRRSDAEGAAGRWEEVPLETAAPPAAGEAPSVEVDLPPGIHALFACGEDRVGNAGAAPERPEEAQARVDVPAAAQMLEPRGGSVVHPTSPTSPASPRDARSGADASSEPRLVLENFHEGAHRGGDRRYVFWKAEGAAAAERIDIEVSADGGASWRPVASRVPAAAGKHAWTLPREPGAARRMLLRLRVPGSAGLESRSREEFLVESRVPRARFLGPRFSRSTTTALRFAVLPPEASPAGEAGDEPTPIAAMECYVRRSPGAPWTLAARRKLDADDLRPSYGILDAGPQPAEPQGGGEGAGGGDLEVEGGQGALEAAIEDGWYEVTLVPEDAVGNRPPLPDDPRLDPERRMLVDTVSPRLVVASEERKDIYAGGETVLFRIRVEDENLPGFPVAIEEAEGTEGGAEWRTLEGRFPRDRVYGYRIPRTPGPRRLRIAAADLAGNRTEEVFTFTVAPPGPRVRLLGLDGPLLVKAGEPLTIRWETAGVEGAPSSVVIRNSRDGGATWSELASDLPNQGVFAWSTPLEDIHDLRLRVEVTDARGLQGTAQSPPIAVSARPPRVALESVEPAGGSPPALRGKEPGGNEPLEKEQGR